METYNFRGLAYALKELLINYLNLIDPLSCKLQQVNRSIKRFLSTVVARRKTPTDLLTSFQFKVAVYRFRELIG